MKILSITISPELYARLRKLRDERGVNCSWLVRRAIEEHLDRLEQRPPSPTSPIEVEGGRHERHDAA